MEWLKPYLRHVSVWIALRTFRNRDPGRYARYSACQKALSLWMCGVRQEGWVKRDRVVPP